MSALSNYAEKLVLDWLMTAGAATRPTTWYVALFTTDPAEDGSGTEVSGFGYSRKAITFDAGATPGGTTQSNNTQTFTAAGGAWGTITHIGIYDASTVGNLLWYGSLLASKTIGDGETLEFTAGNIDLTLA